MKNKYPTMEKNIARTNTYNSILTIIGITILLNQFNGNSFINIMIASGIERFLNFLVNIIEIKSNSNQRIGEIGIITEVKNEKNFSAIVVESTK